MKNSVFLSIIIPVYNNEKYINNCIDSIISQKTLFDYEIIIVNDGSTDCTQKKIDKYEEIPFISIINQENKGAAIARNNGLLHAKGEYVLFVDGDDILREESLNIIYFNLSLKPDLLVFGVQIHYYQKGLVYEQKTTNFFLGIEAKQHIVQSGLLNYICKVHKRRFLHNHQIIFKDLVPAEDMVLSIEVLLQTDKVVIIPDCLYIYNRYGEESAVTRHYKNLENIYRTKIFLMNKLINSLYSENLEIWWEKEEFFHAHDLYLNIFRARNNELNFKQKRASVMRARNLMNTRVIKWSNAQSSLDKIFYCLYKINSSYLTTFVYTFLFLIKEKLS